MAVTLDALAHDPNLARDLPPADRTALLAQAGAVIAVLLGTPATTLEPMGSNLLTAKQLAERLGVPVSKVMSEARADRIPTVRMGRYYRFDFVAVKTALESEDN